MSVKKSRAAKSHIINKVAILDAGGQYVDLVQKAVIRLGIPAEILDLATSRDILEAQYGAVIISGSPVSSYREKAPQPDIALWDSDLPILGICYGMQSMAVAHGGKVATNVIRQDGRITTQIDIDHPIFSGSKKDFTALFTHGDFVTELPSGFTSIGQHILRNGSTAYSAIAHENKVGVQFHPEVFDDTPGGYQIFSNFLMEIAGLHKDTLFSEEQLDSVIEQKRQEIKKQVAGRHVIAFVSGGVDSSVAAMLASTVVPKDKFHAYYIDNGFMRHEDEMVIDALRAAGIAVSKIDAVKKFESAKAIVDGVLVGPLKHVADPEAKRKIIGKAFIETQNDILKNLKLQEALLLQGTNAADRIESGGSKGGVHTMTIKTHHNQVLEVQELKTHGLLLEPLDDLFKDEVRALGRELGLPFELVERQPFPGPGLAIRIIAAQQNKNKIREDPISEAINIYIAECKLDTQKAITAHVLPVRSVGVGGDERSHISVAAISNAGLSSDDLSALATGIPANFRGCVNRVIYALGPQPLKNHHVTKTLLTEAARMQLRQADRIVFEEMRSADLLDKIKQMPVILLPLSFEAPGSRSIVLRPVTTNTFMTVQAMLPGRDLPKKFFENVTRRILTEVTGISQVFLDLTNKPPATTEWE